MRSRHRHVCILWQLIAALVLSMSTSGCQIGRTFFHMDSNSPSPFMGFDLLPKRDRTSPTEGVSRFQDEVVTDLSTNPTRNEPSERPTGRLSRLLGRTTETKPLTLPSTADPETEHASVSMEAPVEVFR